MIDRKRFIKPFFAILLVFSVFAQQQIKASSDEELKNFLNVPDGVTGKGVTVALVVGNGSLVSRELLRFAPDIKVKLYSPLDLSLLAQDHDVDVVSVHHDSYEGTILNQYRVFENTGKLLVLPCSNTPIPLRTSRMLEFYKWAQKAQGCSFLFASEASFKGSFFGDSILGITSLYLTQDDPEDLKELYINVPTSNSRTVLSCVPPYVAAAASLLKSRYSQMNHGALAQAILDSGRKRVNDPKRPAITNIACPGTVGEEVVALKDLYLNQLDMGRALALAAQRYGTTSEDKILAQTYDEDGLNKNQREDLLLFGQEQMLGKEPFQGIELPKEYQFISYHGEDTYFIRERLDIYHIYYSYYLKPIPPNIMAKFKINHAQRGGYTYNRRCVQSKGDETFLRWAENAPEVDPEDRARAKLVLGHMDWLGQERDNHDFRSAYALFESVATSTNIKPRAEDRARALLYLTQMKKQKQVPRPKLLPQAKLTPSEINDIRDGYQQVINYKGVFLQDKLLAKHELEILNKDTQKY